ncbi:hypothetical protein [Dyella telluris]|uniref:Uncharacterized protein n=1 Tax=Dyella telluris TaxID=2763498 RepID=A0A7G8Q5H0_9GAMM|nr:hypothetical protein [Dyella telluris]QNK02028.1 hypothetical protein H8F01_02360 [Dyella telluris]
MLAAHFVPHNEIHVFHGDEWQFSVAELRLRGKDPTQLEPLTHQYCLRAPGLDQVAFDTRDILQMDRPTAWDPHLRVGKLSRWLSHSFDDISGIVGAIDRFMCPLDASVRFETTPSPPAMTVEL